MTDLKHALDEDQVIFGAEEINETMQSVFAFTSGRRWLRLYFSHLLLPTAVVSSMEEVARARGRCPLSPTVGCILSQPMCSRSC